LGKFDQEDKSERGKLQDNGTANQSGGSASSSQECRGKGDTVCGNARVMTNCFPLSMGRSFLGLNHVVMGSPVEHRVAPAGAWASRDDGFYKRFAFARLPLGPKDNPKNCRIPEPENCKKRQT
jgi:hypothetical protein